MARSFIQNVVGFSTASDLVKLGKGYTYNMYQETQDSSEHAVTKILRPFPGYSSVASVTGTPRGLYRVSRGYDGKPKVYGVWGNKLYLVKADNSLYEIGTVNIGSAQVHYAETGGEGSAHPHLVIVDGLSVFAVDTTLSAAEQVEDFRTIRLPYRAGDKTKTVLIAPSHVAYAYGYLVVNDSGTDAIYYSYQFPFETADSAGNVVYDVFRCVEGSDSFYSEYGWVEYAEWQPDNTLAICGNGSRIFTFGERSYQVFSYNSTGNTPFSSPDTAANMVGIKNADTLCVFGSRCVWLGSAEMGDSQVFSLTSDNELERISTPEIERRIASLDQRACRSFMYQIGHHVFYVITFETDNVTMCYDFTEGGWVDLGSNDAKGHAVAFRYSNTAMNHDGSIMLQHDAGLVKIDSTKWNEHDGRSIVRKRAGGIVQVNHHPFFVDGIKLLTNNGEYGAEYSGECKVMVRYSLDGASWEDMETYSMGAVGQYGYDCEFYNLGVAKYLSVEFSCSENVPFALYGMVASLRECR